MSEQDSPETPQEAPQQEQHSPTVASALQLLMSKESAIREQSEALAAREESVKRGMHLQELAQKDPYAVMKELGIDYSQLTDKVLADPEYNPMKGVESKLSALQERLEAQDRAKEEAKRTAAIEEVRNNIRTFVDESEDYPLIKKSGLQDAVYERVQASIAAGQPVSEATAASEVEQQLSSIVTKALEDQELRTKYVGAPEETAPSFLSNNFSQTVSSKNPPPTDSDDDLINKFAAALKFTD